MERVSELATDLMFNGMNVSDLQYYNAETDEETTRHIEEANSVLRRRTYNIDKDTILESLKKSIRRELEDSEETNLVELISIGIGYAYSNGMVSVLTPEEISDLVMGEALQVYI